MLFCNIPSDYAAGAHDTLCSSLVISSFGKTGQAAQSDNKLFDCTPQYCKAEAEPTSQHHPFPFKSTADSRKQRTKEQDWKLSAREALILKACTKGVILCDSLHSIFYTFKLKWDMPQLLFAHTSNHCFSLSFPSYFWTPGVVAVIKVISSSSNISMGILQV